MPGDPFRSVAPGQRLEIPAAAYNAFLDAARHARGRLHDTGGDDDAEFCQTGIIKVWNTTGSGVSPERWAVVQLDDGDYQAHVFITSNVPDEEGYYPGEVQRYDPATKTWQTLFECKVVDINQ